MFPYAITSIMMTVVVWKGNMVETGAERVKLGSMGEVAEDTSA